MQNMIIKHPTTNRNAELWVRHGIGMVIKMKQKTQVYNSYRALLEFRT